MKNRKTKNYALRVIAFTVITFSLLMPCEAIELKIKIQPKQNKEYHITMNGITKETINRETTFEALEGFNVIEIGKKTIKKFISKPSIMEIYYVEN